MKRFRSIAVVLFAVLAAAICRPASGASDPPPLLIQSPTLSVTEIAFAFGGDIWIVPRAGGAARRLVTGYDLESSPIFSPDGSQVAFSGYYDGNTDVYVVPAAGGEPKRLTFHPYPDIAVGWTPDGKSVLFVSHALSTNDSNRLFTVPVSGGYPVPLPLAAAEDGSYSPDGSHIAFTPGFRWEPFWRGYRGGQTSEVDVATLADSTTVRIPRNNANDERPMWLGESVYFLSDRDGPMTLFAYDPQTRRVSRKVPAEGFDITSASAGPDAIVYSQFGALKIYDPRTGAVRAVHVTIAADMPQVRPHWSHPGGGAIEGADLSPSGVRAVFALRGAILTIPAVNGSIRTIAASSSVMNRDPAWSPDGRYIAYFSDESGEYQLHIKDQKGLQPARVIDVHAGSPSFYYTPIWSPDSKKIAYSDKRLNLWYVDLDHPAPVKVATAPYESFGPNAFGTAWSPDSRWIVYVNQLPNFLHAAYVFNVANRTTHQLTDGLSDVGSPQFDASGKYLYFTASTNTGLTSAGLDMTSDQHPVSSSVYLAVLAHGVASPVNPQSDDEPEKTDEPATPAGPKTAPKPSAAPEKPVVRIDFTGFSQRIVALPLPDANWIALVAGKPGELFAAATDQATTSPQSSPADVVKFDLATRKSVPYVSGITSFTVSANGQKVLYAQGPRWFIANTAVAPPMGAVALATGNLEVAVDPPAEWKQMYHETWRIERDFFYDPHYHGLDLVAAEKRFEPYLAGITSRDDLSFLFREMLSYLSVGHMFVGGGAEPAVPRVTTGLLGADYRIANGRYQFTKIYDGENWNPELMAPLTQPGAEVHADEYLLAVNGKSLTASDDLYAGFEETVGKQVTIRVGPHADGSGARDVVVVPIANEFELRNYGWIEENRRKVDALSGGKLGYVYLPDTAYGGFTNFNRYFFAQVGKEGVIIDERFNHGGQLADYVVDYLERKPQSILVPREGKLVVDPPLAIFGPKVMLINQFSGSGGDALPWYFHKNHVGPLVGERTWGGLVGIGGTPSLKDGGSVQAPHIAIAGLRGHYEVENQGIAPDITVWQDPKLVREGHDPQLEAGVREALALLKAHPIPTFPKPAYPDFHPKLPPQ
jgi:tricorn protease